MYNLYEIIFSVTSLQQKMEENYSQGCRFDPQLEHFWSCCFYAQLTSHDLYIKYLILCLFKGRQVNKISLYIMKHQKIFLLFKSLFYNSFLLDNAFNSNNVLLYMLCTKKTEVERNRNFYQKKSGKNSFSFSFNIIYY